MSIDDVLRNLLEEIKENLPTSTLLRGLELTEDIVGRSSIPRTLDFVREMLYHEEDEVAFLSLKILRKASRSESEESIKPVESIEEVDEVEQPKEGIEEEVEEAVDIARPPKKFELKAPEITNVYSLDEEDVEDLEKKIKEMKEKYVE
ncbi:hypothetical protein DRN72_02210 [Methanosarcinales archaeon]|nr:MAG: hypothetical protein DRN72_02210 [Methanosarcinales archaeon]